jgi:colanic acid biosynthesis glycosyl transferase WcaI
MEETTRPLSILVFCQYFFPENFGVNAIAVDLASRGHRVTVLTGMPNYPSGTFAPGYGGCKVRRETYQGVQVIRVPLVARSKNSRIRLALNYLSYAFNACLLAPFLVRDKPDVMLVYQLSPVTIALPALLMKAVTGSKVLLWVQDIWPESVSATTAIQNGVILGLLRSLVRLVYRGSSIIAVQSPRFIDFIRPLAPLAADFRYLPNTVDNFYKPVNVGPNTPQRRFFRKGFTLLFAGNLGLAQDIDSVVDAIERLRHRVDIQWIFVGDGQRRSWLERQIRERGLSDNAQVIGPFPPEQMPVFFALADALLMTLRDEQIFSLTIPSKLQSYLACGRPILGAIDGAAADVLTESGAGLVALPNDPERLAEAVTMMADLPLEHRLRMAQAALSYHKREFDRQFWIGRLDGWLAELATSGSKH